MRCYICDTHLSEKEGQFNEDHKKYDPCSNCIELSGTNKFHASDIEVLEAIVEMNEDESKRLLDETETDQTREVPLS